MVAEVSTHYIVLTNWIRDFVVDQYVYDPYSININMKHKDGEPESTGNKKNTKNCSWSSS
jgi:hypothetical protein